MGKALIFDIKYTYDNMRLELESTTTVHIQAFSLTAAIKSSAKCEFCYTSTSPFK